tara:strand:- start:640 stop:981 length:342 start_codon:yes stop_codon:yes gene_type:complete
MIKLFNNFFWPLGLLAIGIVSVTFAYSSWASTYEEQKSPINLSKPCPVLETHQDTLDYVKENIDVNSNGMPDDLEHGTDSIYQIILDNQKAIEEISVDLDRIHAKLDELTATR